MQHLAPLVAHDAFCRSGIKAVPLVFFGQLHRASEVIDLLGGQKRRVVAGVARHRQAPSLDRVGEDNARSICLFVAGDESVGKRFKIMATEILDQIGHLVIIHAGEELMHRLGGVFQEALSNLSGSESEERLILLIGHLVYP